ncbi:MAG TPA: glycosyltransferase family 2 protein [Verrucomicrobiae bacterium]|nr:glycosyltransferase family 2 protein [Verrucomicrobiae bacterium]
MNWASACAAVIPCLNEERAIGPLVEAVRAQVSTVYVVDDGSCDNTSARAQAAGAIVLKNVSSQGKGAALTAGWSRAREHGFRWALSLDGDGQHSPEDIARFFECAERTSAALVVGNRMPAAAQMPRVRRWVNRFMSRQLSWLIGQAMPDSQCGFRLMNLEDWAGLPIRAEHFEIESEVLFQFAMAGRNIQFVPIEVIYKQEQSKIHPWRDSLRWLRWYQQAGRARPSGGWTPGLAAKNRPKRDSMAPGICDARRTSAQTHKPRR